MVVVINMVVVVSMVVAGVVVSGVHPSTSSHDLSSPDIFGQSSVPSHFCTLQIRWLLPGQAIWVSALHPDGWGRGWGSSTPPLSITRHQPEGKSLLKKNPVILRFLTPSAMTSLSCMLSEFPLDRRSTVVRIRLRLEPALK